jgi:hypothetical protein
MIRRTSWPLVALTFAVSLGLVAPAKVYPAISIDLGINLGAPPSLVLVPGLPVYYAPTLPYNYFFYGQAYYTFVNAQWYSAPSYNGPWTVTPVARLPAPLLSVPVQYYKVPPGHWKSPGPPPWAHHGKRHGHGRDKKGKHHGHHDD